MPVDGPETPSLLLPKLGAAIAGMALFFPALRMPLVLGCLAALGNLALTRERPAQDVVPETPPLGREPRNRPRRSGASVTETSEDSFPASDPPSWTPVSGTGTQH